MNEKYFSLRKDQHALDALNKLFAATVGEPDGCHARRYRADNSKDIPILRELSQYSFIEDRDGRYKLRLISVICLAEISEDASRVLGHCASIFKIVRQHCRDELDDPISLNDISAKAGITKSDAVIAMRYFKESGFLQGYPTKFPDCDDETVTISENVFEYEDFQEYVKQQKEWHPPTRLEEISAPKVLPSAIQVVMKALTEARASEGQGNAASAVDRVHTAFHGYLKVVCNDFDINAEPDATTSKLFKQIRQHHPAFQENGPRANDVERMLRSVSTTIDASTPIRNKASLAHANGLLDEPEARAVINAVYTVFRYIQDCLARYENRYSYEVMLRED